MRERMGSGGLRGLQIPRSGASRIRGGFDSHAFPPLLRAALCAALLAAGTGLAAPRAFGQVPADSAATPTVPVVNDTTVVPVRAERVRRTVSVEDSVRRHAWHEAPRWVMARSVILPGWGQAHNGAWFKATAVATGEIWLGSLLVQDQRELNRLSQELADADAENDDVRYGELVNQYNATLEQRTARQWLFGALLAYAMIDAYVDAHFRGFEIEFKTDPALPAGPEPASGGRGGMGARLALRWDF